MEYKLYTLVDITHTKLYRTGPGQEALRWKEQNFNTVLQTLGIRANVTYIGPPMLTEIKGSLIGFYTDKIIRVWRFDFFTDRDSLYEQAGDPIGLLKEDFHLVPYIQGLDEDMTQKYAVFNSKGPGENIVFHLKT
jgi:hypothetical protein